MWKHKDGVIFCVNCFNSVVKEKSKVEWRFEAESKETCDNCLLFELEKEKIMTGTTEITKVTYRWDDQIGVDPGWYCQSFAGDRLIEDSQKIIFPVTTEGLSETELIGQLKAAFPGAEIQAEEIGG